MPNKAPRKPKPLYRKPTPKRTEVRAPADFSHAQPVPLACFELREDGEIVAAAPHPDPLPRGEGTAKTTLRKSEDGLHRRQTAEHSPSPWGEGRGEGERPALLYRSESPFVRLYHGNCLELLDAIAAQYPDGRFDMIFADPPYFLSNGGITCHAGKMVKVDKGDWDKSRGPELNHEFNLEWLARCQRVLKPNGTIWVSGTHHVIFSIGYALQQLGCKILNDIAWEKPNPPPNLSCRYFTHSTETILWAAKNEKSKHTFNYQEMRKVTGKQMKTVWRKGEFTAEAQRRGDKTSGSSLSPREERAGREPERGEIENSAPPLPNPLLRSAEERELSSIWTLTAPGSGEKEHGKHPTQKPVALVERCLLASTNEGDLVLDPFLGNGTTAVACVRLKRQCVGIELDLLNVQIAKKRIETAIHDATDLFTASAGKR